MLHSMLHMRIRVDVICRRPHLHFTPCHENQSLASPCSIMPSSTIDPSAHWNEEETAQPSDHVSEQHQQIPGRIVFSFRDCILTSFRFTLLYLLSVFYEARRVRHNPNDCL